MDNQHQKIKGYRDLSQEEIDLMNEGKELAEKVGDFIARLEGLSNPLNASSLVQHFEIDGRWVSIGKTHLQQGFMAAIRSIAKPTTF